VWLARAIAFQRCRAAGDRDPARVRPGRGAKSRGRHERDVVEDRVIGGQRRRMIAKTGNDAIR